MLVSHDSLIEFDTTKAVFHSNDSTGKLIVQSGANYNGSVTYYSYSDSQGVKMTIGDAANINYGQPYVRLAADNAKPVSLFTDVASDSWYYLAVQWAVKQGITNGTGINPATFSPMRDCKQVEILAFLWRAAGEQIGRAHV